MRNLIYLFLICFCTNLSAQEYFLKDLGPFDSKIISPEHYLGYPIGFQHTRHDRIVDYLKELARLSDKAEYVEYGRSHEGRILGMLVISTKNNIKRLEEIRTNQLLRCYPIEGKTLNDSNPVIINLGYNVHGNEPSSSEAALLTAYIMISSQNPEIEKYLNESVLFIDPTINPDGRDRHTQWANSFKGKNLIVDPMDIEHWEGWPRGRTNHYWFDLNRDWWLAIHPESRGKLNWYHNWYPNVVTDFHEMGTNSSYFFEPMKDNGSKNPIMPKENYIDLNNKFGEYYSKALDEIGSFYFTKEVFDGTYPGYGSSYPDLQGGLGILFEQASSRGHAQTTPTGEITFAYTIRNQLTSSMATIKASVENRQMLFDYQKAFFSSSFANAKNAKVKAYVFGEAHDKTRLRAFLDKLIIHRVEFYELAKDLKMGDQSYQSESSFIVPTEQTQYRMVQSMFETYNEFRDSVFYDASAWSLANFYNIPYSGLNYVPQKGKMISALSVPESKSVDQAKTAYIIPWDDYNAPAVLNQLHVSDLVVKAGFKKFSIQTSIGERTFNPGSIMIPVSQQKINAQDLHRLVEKITKRYNVELYAINTSYSSKGVDLGSRYVTTLTKPKVLTFVGDGISSYEAGEIWHLMDQRVDMMVTKAQLRTFNSLDFDKYNTLVMVSGSYAQLDSLKRKKIKDWIGKGNTLITIRTATSWAINNKIVDEKLVDKEEKKKQEEKKDEKDTNRLPWIDAPEIEGKKRVGGAIFEVDLDITHPIGFGYHRENLPVYRNSTVWITPSKNPYSNVAVYSMEPHIDGFITKENLDENLKKSASIIVSKVGSGRAVLFAENPNFRGSWYGTNKLFLNAIFFGDKLSTPTVGHH
jgi:hypothetical protein